jgi:hypothetical protein
MSGGQMAQVNQSIDAVGHGYCKLFEPKCGKPVVEKSTR